MSVKLTNFVNIKINHHLNISVNATRDTAALIHYKYNASKQTPQYSEVFTATPDTTSGTYTYLAGIKDYLDAFFANGGKKIYVITMEQPTFPSSDLSAELTKLPMEYVMVGFVNDSTNGVNALPETTFRTAAAAWNTANANEKIYQKIFDVEIPYSAGLADLTPYIDGSDKVVSIENYVLKYGAQGIGASVLAYFTQIDVYSFNATQDYAFTTEVYDEADASHFVINDNDIIEKIIALDLNADTKLAGKVKNVGGNDTAGYDLTNQFMLLVVHQTLTEAVVKALANKVKYNEAGAGVILNAIVRELNRFVSNGYLATNKVWTDPTLYYDSYKIIDTNTVLNAGYKVTILPFTSLSPEEKAAHQLPKIYILLADSYSIRKVVIDGEVF